MLPLLPEFPPPPLLFRESKIKTITTITIIGNIGKSFPFVCLRSPLYLPLKTSKEHRHLYQVRGNNFRL
jgi:hypothetical protein